VTAPTDPTRETLPVRTVETVLCERCDRIFERPVGSGNGRECGSCQSNWPPVRTA
jgi:hypothetical protein